MIPLTNEQQELYEQGKICYNWEKIEHQYTNDKNFHKVRNPCHYTGKYKGAAYSNYSIPKEVLVNMEIWILVNMDIIIKNEKCLVPSWIVRF